MKNLEDIKYSTTEQMPLKKHRDSNLELFRILTMLLIVAHHYVFNSGLTAPGSPLFENPTSADSLFLLLFGAWGKIGINCFVMITGYFMCQSEITATKFVKLLFEVMFYQIVIGGIFLITGYQNFTWFAFFELFIPIKRITVDFKYCFLVFYLFIPFLNILIKNLTEKKHIYLLLLCFLTYILFGTIKGGPFVVIMNYVSWFSVLYIIASYIRLYPKRWFSNNKICVTGLMITVLLSTLSVVFCSFIGEKIDKFVPLYFVTDSNALLAVLVGIFAFLFFKNIKLKYNKVINIAAASTFGVLLIHANSNIMRQWLWKDMLDCEGHYGSTLYAIVCTIGVFGVCTIIDFVIKNTVEKSFLSLWQKKYEYLKNVWMDREKKIFDKIS